MIATCQGDRPIGLATCYAADFRNQHAKVALVERVDIADPSPGTVAGFLQFIDHVFETFPFRKLYLDVLEWDETLVLSILRAGARFEGRLTGHELSGSGALDLVVLAVHRNDWDGLVHGLAQRSSSDADDGDFRAVVASTLAWSPLDPRFDSPRLWQELDSLDRLLVLDLLEHGTGRGVPDEAVESFCDEASLRHVYLALRGR